MNVFGITRTVILKQNTNNVDNFQNNEYLYMSDAEFIGSDINFCLVICLRCVLGMVG